MTGRSLAACFIVLLAGLPPGCVWARRASVDAVDPELRAKGLQLARGDEPNGFRLGSYLVSAPQLAREAPEPDGESGLAQDGAPRPVVAHRLDLEVVADDRQWAIRCKSQRRQPASMDYAAVLDENQDEIAVSCDLDRDNKRQWAFVTEAELSHNFAGTLTEQGSERVLTVEVVMYVERFGKIRRHLPDPVAQVRDGETIVAAMVLARPEQAWVSRSSEPEVVDAAMSAMLALRFLPLGLEG